MQTHRIIAAFDLDGTLTHRDTMVAFIQYVVGKRKWFWGLLMQLPMIIGWKVFGILSRTKAKGRFLHYYFGKIPKSDLEKRAKAFVQSHKDIFKEDALARLQWHKNQGHTCVIVSASVDIWVAPLAKALGLPYLSSKAHFNGEKCVGLDGANCRGQEKVNRLKAFIGEQPLDKTYAYGDTAGDRELIAWADEGIWANKPLPRWE
ncbi:MAG: HAD family hydrolase [Bacteroidia bacterium]